MTLCQRSYISRSLSWERSDPISPKAYFIYTKKDAISKGNDISPPNPTNNYAKKSDAIPRTWSLLNGSSQASETAAASMPVNAVTSTPPWLTFSSPA